MRLLAHLYHVHPYAYWTLCGTFIVIFVSWPFARLRRNRRRIAALAEIFDPGTSDFDSDSSGNCVRGLFLGRPATVSVRTTPWSRIEVSVAGRFYLPFEAQTLRWRWIRRIQSGMNFAGAWMHSFVTLFVPFYALLRRPGGSISTAFAQFTIVCLAFWLMVYIYGKLMGYFEGANISVCAVDLPGLGVRPFETFRPEQFRAAIQHPEIRESFAHLFDSCGADMLRVPGIVNLRAKDRRKWAFSVGVTWLSRDRFLNKEAVSKTLTELVTLCAELDQFAPDPMLSWTRA